MKDVCCLAHVRRKFYETLQVDPENVHAGFVLLKIGEIYAVE
jgi:Transposase IS66 family